MWGSNGIQFSTVVRPPCEKPALKDATPKAALVVPDPGVGAQKKTTLKKRRMRSKMAPDDAYTPHKKQKPQKGRKTTHKKLKRRMTSDAIVPPAKYEVRQGTANRGAEAYIIDSKPRDRYIAQQSKAKSAEHLSNVERLTGLINEGEVTSKRVAQAWLLDHA